MRFAFLAAALLVTGCAASAPAADTSPEAEAVRAAVVHLFDGMRAGDSTMVRAVIHPEASFRTVVPQGEGFRLATGDAEAFIAAVGSARDEVWDEQIGPIEVQVDQGLATAWMTYDFIRGETFSHCGVNAMQFAKTDGTWRIVHLIDTRRQECGDEG